MRWMKRSDYGTQRNGKYQTVDLDDIEQKREQTEKKGAETEHTKVELSATLDTGGVN